MKIIINNTTSNKLYGINKVLFEQINKDVYLITVLTKPQTKFYHQNLGLNTIDISFDNLYNSCCIMFDEKTDRKYLSNTRLLKIEDFASDKNEENRFDFLLIKIDAIKNRKLLISS